jgi:hypothetical protein
MLLVFGLLLVPLSVAGAGELPSPGGKPLSAILKLVEEGKVGVIAEAHTAHFASARTQAYRNRQVYGQRGPRPPCYPASGITR